MIKEIIKADHSKISSEQMILEIKSYLLNKKDAKIIVGADSQKIKRKFSFATCVAVIDPGNGGIFYILKKYKNPHKDFKNISSMIAWKVYQQAEDIMEMMNILQEYGVVIKEKITHHDLSIGGLSGIHINGITGWMKSLGYDAKIKPEAIIASGIANSFSKT